jgi:hypothetical protein
MSTPSSSLSQENFASTVASGRSCPADFSTEQGALEYARGRLDELFAAMRLKLEKHIAGWPGDDRELDTFEALRHLLRDISFGHAAYVEADYENPALTKMGATSRIQFQLPSPDCVYHCAILHGDYRYRLSGYRGSAAVFQQTVYRGHACNLLGWRTHSRVNNFDEPRLAAGQHIDIVLSRTRPDELGAAVWLELPEGPCELHSRQYYGDWETEQPADLLLRLEGQRFPARLLDRASSETRFNRLLDLLRVHTDFYRAGVQAHLNADPHEIGELVIPTVSELWRLHTGAAWKTR